jgi:hypothetical protein
LGVQDQHSWNAIVSIVDDTPLHFGWYDGKDTYGFLAVKARLRYPDANKLAHLESSQSERDQQSGQLKSRRPRC